MQPSFVCFEKTRLQRILLWIDNDIDMINMSNKFYKRNNYKNFKFHKENSKIQNQTQFDLVLIWGVISFFDNYKQFIDKMDRCLNKNGTISLFSGFSESNYNVYVKYKIGDGKSQAGLNMHSLNEIESYFKKKGYKISKQKFIPSVNLIKSKNPLSSFVLYEQNRNKVIANGLNIIRKFYFIKAEKLYFFFNTIIFSNTIASKSEFWRIYKASIWFSAIGIPATKRYSIKRLF